MNSKFIDFILENIFSEVIPVAETLFDLDGICIKEGQNEIIRTNTCVIYDHPLELSWFFEMVLKAYHDEINEHNRLELLSLMAREANRIICFDYPKQAVFLSVINVANYWFLKRYQLKSNKIIKQHDEIDYLYDIYK
jgi:hypothetical protein